MELELIIGYILTVLTGVVLGILGGGGSMMILPIFVYLFHVEPKLAVLYSLFVIGFSSVLGALSHFRMGHVNLKLVLSFGLPSVISVLLTRTWLLPLLPEVIFEAGGYQLKQTTFLLVLFALLMVVAAVYMIINAPKSDNPEGNIQINWTALVLQGLLVGILTGLVGAGGGFLIIPALVYFTKMPIKYAVGTSLTIIACNTLIGFAGSVSNATIDWSFVLVFAALTGIGILFGSFWSRKINPIKLKAAFGYFILLVAALMIFKEIF